MAIRNRRRHRIQEESNVDVESRFRIHEEPNVDIESNNAGNELHDNDWERTRLQRWRDAVAQHWVWSLTDIMNDFYDNDMERTRWQRWKAAVARRGLCSLAVAVIPAALHVLDIFVIRSAERAGASPSWFKVWRMDAMLVWSSLVVGLSSWFAWAENGGFRRRPMELAILYVTYFSLSLAWNPVVFGFRALKVGCLVCAVKMLFVLVIGTMLKELNQTAGTLVFNIGGLNSYFLLHMTVLLIPWWDDR